MTNQFAVYHGSYSQKSLRGIDTTVRPDLVNDLARQYSGQNKRLLDMGCGNLHKMIPLSTCFKQIVGIDPSSELIKQAQSTIEADNLSNVRILQGTAQNIPIFSEKFDVVTAILTFWDPQSLYEIIKPDGIFLIECLGPEDKTSFTIYFGKDDAGWRGANIGKTFADMENEIKQKLHPHFHVNYIYNREWYTAYTEEGLWALLNNTYSTVRNFDPTQDQFAFEKACSELLEDNKIILKQNRLVISATPCIYTS